MAHSGHPLLHRKCPAIMRISAYHLGDASLTGFATNNTIGTRATMTIDPTIVSRCDL